MFQLFYHNMFGRAAVFAQHYFGDIFFNVEVHLSKFLLKKMRTSRRSWRPVLSVWTTNICQFSSFPGVVIDHVSGTVLNNTLVGHAIARETWLLLTAATSGGGDDGDGGTVRACVRACARTNVIRAGVWSGRRRYGVMRRGAKELGGGLGQRVR